MEDIARLREERERYRALLRLTRDPAARQALSDLIREVSGQLEARDARRAAAPPQED